MPLKVAGVAWEEVSWSNTQQKFNETWAETFQKTRGKQKQLKEKRRLDTLIGVYSSVE